METRYIRYSANADGSNMTTVKMPDTKYVGVGYMPNIVTAHENLLLNSNVFSQNWTTYANPIIESVGRYSTFKKELTTTQQTDPTGLSELLRYSGITLKPNTSYVFSFYEEEATGEYATYVFPAVIPTNGNNGIIKTSEGEKSGNEDTRVPWTQRGNGVRKWVIFKTKSDISGLKGILFRYNYKDPKVNFSLKISRPSLTEGENVLPWNTTANEWLADKSNFIWSEFEDEVVMYSPNPDGSNSTPEREANSRYIGYGNMPIDICANPNLISSKTSYVDRGVMELDWKSPLQLIGKLGENGFVGGKNFTVTSTIKIPINAPSAVRLQGRYNVSGSSDFIDRPDSNSVAYNIIYPGGEQEIIATGQIPDIVPDIGFQVRYGRLNSDGTGDTFTVQGKCDGLFLGDNITTWKPSPADWKADKGNFTWTEIPSPLLPEHVDDVDDIFPITKLRLSNGIYYHLNVTKDTSLPYTRDIPSWTYETIIDVTFAGTLNGGNTNILLSQLEGLIIKRRKVGTFKWIALKEIKVNSISDLNIVYQDSFVPSSYEFEYALVPILNGNIEGEYITSKIWTKFNGVFISDRDTIFKLYNSITYGGITANREAGILKAIGNKYPTFISNAETKYKEGQISALLLGYGFEKTRDINRLDVVNQVEDLIEFLNNGDAKVITDWNGNIYVVRINPSPTISYNPSYGNGISTVSFNWTEQGKYDDQEDLYENNLVDTLG